MKRMGKDKDETKEGDRCDAGKCGTIQENVVRYEKRHLIKK